jgi:myo-inositol 2-dehydrogenase / D-chiro-inositol 1-dehydrogenase
MTDEVATKKTSPISTAAALQREPGRWWTRRRFLKLSAGLSVGSGALAAGYYATRDRIGLGLIGCGHRGSELAQIAQLSGYYLQRYGKIVALTDVHREKAEQVRARYAGGAEVYQDYRRVLDRDDVEAVIVATPDHWHAAISMDALRAGKAVYHEKPFSHTVAESQALLAAVKSAGLPFLVGTHQRNMWSCRTAAELVRNGRLGNVPRATVTLFNKGWQGGPFPPQPVPRGLDWDRWLGPAPEAAFCPERYEKFHGWWDYGGGEMMNWGSHHVDIAMWAMDLGRVPLVKVTGSGRLPSIAGGFEIPADFTAQLEFATGQTIDIRTTADRERPSGVLFQGEKGSLWTDRENLDGPAATELASKPLPPDAIRLHPGPAVKSMPTVRHLTHFYDVVRGSSPPVSDAESAHATNVALHLANISVRLGRTLRWDAASERIIDDDAAIALQNAPRRSGYEL